MEKNSSCKISTLPKANISLGKTNKERQKKYRSLCDACLRTVGLLEDQGTVEMESPFIGRAVWPELRRQQIKQTCSSILEG